MEWVSVLWFVGCIAIFVLLPIIVYFTMKYFLSARSKRIVVNAFAGAGMFFALFMLIYPAASGPHDVGAIGLMLLIPLGGLLAVTCAGILWVNNWNKKSA
ncbi:MAG: hypothetical protein ACPG5U_07700 [Planktomarina sp.]